MVLNFKFQIFGLFLVFVCCCGSAEAKVSNRVDIFDVDLDRKLPPREELTALYVKDAPSDYSWNYGSQLTIGNMFDKAFKFTIGEYGQSEVRLKTYYEDDLIKMLEKMPKKFYQYIGPLLHKAPGMSEKILNMPGIKETKNKFPTRIAPQLEHIEDLEFLSPVLYILLMPEAWPGYVETEDDVAPKQVFVPKVTPKVDYDPNFIEELKKLVPEDDYVGEAKSSKVSLSDLRTIKPSKTSRITSADVKAFVNTVSKINAFGDNLETKMKILQAEMLIDVWERDNIVDIGVPALKDMVYPCRRLAQKIRYAGLESQFVSIVSEDGFDLNGWAYTCDKTIRAQRVSKMHTAKLSNILALQRGLQEYYLSVDDYNAKTQLITGQALIDMYSAPIEDVLEVKKNSKFLEDNFKSNRFKIITAPVIINR